MQSLPGPRDQETLTSNYISALSCNGMFDAMAVNLSYYIMLCKKIQGLHRAVNLRQSREKNMWPTQQTESQQKHTPTGFVSARVVASVCQIFTWSMMTNVWCVTVFCIDVKGFFAACGTWKQQDNRCDFHIQLLRNCGFVQMKCAFFHHHHHQSVRPAP